MNNGAREKGGAATYLSLGNGAGQDIHIGGKPLHIPSGETTTLYKGENEARGPVRYLKGGVWWSTHLIPAVVRQAEAGGSL